MPTYCNCEDPDLIEDGSTSVCDKCGGLVRNNPPDPQEARIKELEQEVATANSLCRIAQGKVVAQSGMLKEAEDVACNAVGDLETAENRIRELEKKGKVQPAQRTCVKCGGTEHTKSFQKKQKRPYVDLRCQRNKCPEHEHLDIICSTCHHHHWQHCADHV